MKNGLKILFAVALTMILMVGLHHTTTMADTDSGFCCNNGFPGYWYTYPTQKYNPDAPAGMRCSNTTPKENDITRRICARYWSAYMDPDSHVPGDGGPTEMCDYLPGTPPLPAIPVPKDFSVSETANHTKLTWHHYYVHWYDIHRKTDSGSWSRVQRITLFTTNSWTDQSADISNHCYCYKMRGSVYDSYSNYTSVKSIGAFTGSMSGPSSLDPYEVGTFTAHPSLCGVSPYDYTWYRMEGGGPEPLRGGVQPLRPPVGQWVHLSWFDGSQTATSSGVYPGFKMRVDVEDHEGSVVTVEKTVSVGGGLKKSLVKEEPQQKVPDRFALLPNYPNPFNPSTKIGYSLAEESRVTLSVYNVLGEKITSLVNDLQAEGSYSVLWDGKDENGKSVQGGIYLYRIEAVPVFGEKPFTETGKMVLMK